MAQLYVPYRHTAVKNWRIARKWALVLFVSAWISGSAGYAALGSELLVIRDININGASILSESAIREVVDAGLSGTIYRIFPRNNYFFASTIGTEKALLERFPELESVRVKRVFPKLLTVAVKERQYAAVWCGTPDKHCYLLDKQGIIYREAATASGTLIMVINGTPSGPVRMGGTVMDPSHVSMLVSLRSLLKERAHVAISSFNYDSERRESGAVTPEGWRIIFDISQDPENVTDAVSQVIRNNSVATERLEYIDARIEGRAYYKLQPEESPKGS